jgi:hypothetical protein
MTANFLQWNPFIQTGTFSFKDIGMQALYFPGIIVMKLFPNPFGYNFLLLFHYSLAGFFTFLFLREQKLIKTAAFLGGMIFMFCGFLAAHKGHHTMMMSSAYLPIVLYFIERYFTTTKISNLFLGAFAFSLSILADYIAVPMYIGMVSYPYIIFRALTESAFTLKNFPGMSKKIFLSSFIIYMGGLFLAAIEVVPIIESLPYINRQSVGYDFFSSYSFPIEQLPMLLFPFIFGTQSPSPTLYSNIYYGQWNLTEMAGYMGILPFLFAVLSVLLFGKIEWKVYFWAAVSLFAFVLVLGDSTPIYPLMYKVPIYNMFRASARNWLEVNFAVAILSSFFVHNIITDQSLLKQRFFDAVTWLVLAFGAVVVFILAFSKNLISSVELKQAWLENTRLDSAAIFIPLTIIFISIILLYFLYRYKGQVSYWIVIGIVIFLDLFSFGHFHDTGYATYDIFQNRKNEIASFLDGAEHDPALYRILTLNMTDIEKQLYPNINMLYGFNAVNAYSPIWMRDYKSLTTFVENGILSQKISLLHNSKIISLLSTKYVITADPSDVAFLESLYTTSHFLPDSVVLSGAQENQWEFISVERGEDSSAILRSAGPNQVSLMQIPFELQPGVMYKVKFKARITNNSSSPGDILIVDLFGENYDFPQQEYHYASSMLSNEFQEFDVSLYSGFDGPALAFLRLFTFSEGAYEIKDVELFETIPVVPYFGSKEIHQNLSLLYVPVYEESNGARVYENINFLPRVRFVSNIMPVKNAGDAINILWSDDDLNPATTALVEGLENEKFGLNDGVVLQTDFSKNNLVRLTVKTGEKGFLVLSDTWYPGWVATVDGREIQIYKTNAVSRGILIEGEGQHQVEFKFVPVSFYIGLLVSGLTALIMILWSVIAHKMEPKSVL